MIVVYNVHRVFGEMILPLLVLAAGLAFVLRGGAQPTGPPAARILAVLIDIQVTLGLVWWIYSFEAGFALPRGLASPAFFLHPLLGLATAGFGHMSIGSRSPFLRKGRVGRAAAVGILLLLVVATIFAGKLGR
jgi:hypothetical protein